MSEIYVPMRFGADEWITFCFKFLLGREPDFDGREHFREYLRNNPDISPHEFANVFIGSPEFSSKHPRQAIHSLGETASVHTINGVEIYVRQGDWVYASAIVDGVYEPWVADIIRKCLPIGGCFLDLGGNMGIHSAVASAVVGPTGQVFVVEANAENAGLIRRSSREFGRANIVTLPVALSDGARICLLSVDDVGTNKAIGQAGEPVMTAALDQLLPDLERVDLIKLDVEGHEEFVIRGAQQTINRFKPPIIAEYSRHDNRQPYVKSLFEMGYSVRLIRHDCTLSDFCANTDLLDKLIPESSPVMDILFTRSD
ncbi:FkbM family methyltransferase [Sphingobium nicotianae]|uniref:FkbM family methyltransferase n=1 Tax=Sphingobium nicotianae TaxID=2782607 RepID=A0A9X1IRM7_9SPHN|nr:FkbM family methyltransferase [Sphingobium nicotianae]MBT2187512.1 FkbM family methyltransferase [Sphingobium nicotianae]